MSNPHTVVPQAGAMVRQGFGTTELAVASEVSATAVAKRQEATIQALFVMAERRPRDWDTVRSKLLRDCQRTQFAEVARYHKPVGQGIEGPSIRFAEAAMRAMGNLMIDAQVTLEDERKRKIEVVIIDLETCVRFAREVVIEKVVERTFVKEGQTVLGERTNSKGKTVYLVQATEDDLLNKQAAQISKAMRSEGLRLLPGDILEECMETCTATLKKKDAQDPDAARKKLIDAFGTINVTPANLKEYLGHELAQMVPAELQQLRGLYQAIKDGEGTWQAAIEAKRTERKEVLSDTKPIDAKPASPPPSEPAKPKMRIEDDSQAPDVLLQMRQVFEADEVPTSEHLNAWAANMPKGKERAEAVDLYTKLQKRAKSAAESQREPGAEG